MNYLLKDRQKIYKKFSNIDITSFDKKSVLGHGVQGKVYRYCTKNNFCVAVKKMYVDKNTSRYINKTNSKQALENSILSELFIKKNLINKILLEGVSPNFVFLYNYHFEERDGICYEDYPYASYFYNEYQYKTEELNDWIYKKRSIKMLYNAFFQIISAIYTIQKQFNLLHLDLHSANILVKNITPGGYFKYIINNIEYNVPNLGYLFIIIDFGFGYIPKNKNKDREYDVKFILNDIKSDIPEKILNDLKYITKNLKSNKINFEDLINEIWGDMYKKVPNSSKLLEVYYVDKKIKLENKIKEIIKKGFNDNNNY